MNSLIKTALLLAISLSAMGCSSIKTKELSSETSTNLKGKSLVLSKYGELPDFAAQTAVNVQFGLIGLATAISNGNSIIKSNHIEDPAFEISKKLALGLQENQGIKFIEGETKLGSSRDINDIVKIYAGYDYILDVKTLNWSSIYYTSDWDNYRIFYSAHARLIDSKSSSVVAEEACAAAPEYQNTNDAPSYEDLETGKGLKKELTRAIDFCVERISNMAKLHQQSKIATNQ